MRKYNSQTASITTGIMVISIILLLLSACAPSPQVRFSVIQAPQTLKNDWQMIKSTPTDQRFASAVGDIRILIKAKNHKDLADFRAEVAVQMEILAIGDVEVVSRSSIETCAFSDQCLSQYLIVQKENTDASIRRRLEFYQTAEYLVFVNINNNIDAKSYEAMQAFLTDELTK